METLFSCEVRSIKGVPILVCEDGAMLRPRFAPGLLPASFRTVRGRASLRAAAGEVAPAGEEPNGFAPCHGVPETFTGVVVDRLERALVLDAGAVLAAELPAGCEPRQFKLGARVRCHLAGEVVVERLIVDA